MKTEKAYNFGPHFGADIKPFVVHISFEQLQLLTQHLIQHFVLNINMSINWEEKKEGEGRESAERSEEHTFSINSLKNDG